MSRNVAMTAGCAVSAAAFNFSSNANAEETKEAVIAKANIIRFMDHLIAIFNDAGSRDGQGLNALQRSNDLPAKPIDSGPSDLHRHF